MSIRFKCARVLGVLGFVGGFLQAGSVSPARASSLIILKYGGAVDLSWLDDDVNHVYQTKAVGDACWTSTACLSAYDVIAVGANPSGTAGPSPDSAFLDLANSAVQTVTAGANAVLGELFHDDAPQPGMRTLWTQ